VPQNGYFALGDNSYNSYDSRYWGTVPEANLVGRGLLVYWPFNWHWGIIR
jgi:signal peptidase I